MYSQHPELAKEFEEATPKDKKLPEHVKAKQPTSTSTPTKQMTNKQGHKRT